MIVDWTVEVGPEVPTIAVPWPGWVDLRSRPELAGTLPEAVEYPELVPLLLRRNRMFLTAKVDVFAVSRDEVDPELSESVHEEETTHGLGSYLDCVCTVSSFPAEFVAFERVARAIAEQLRTVHLPRAVAEIVIRPARLYDGETFGWTLYAIGFGPSPAAAREVWKEAGLATIQAFELCLERAIERARKPQQAGE